MSKQITVAALVGQGNRAPYAASERSLFRLTVTSWTYVEATGCGCGNWDIQLSRPIRRSACTHVRATCLFRSMADTRESAFSFRT
jgi:hypothetical protein